MQKKGYVSTSTDGRIHDAVYRIVKSANWLKDYKNTKRGGVLDFTSIKLAHKGCRHRYTRRRHYTSAIYTVPIFTRPTGTRPGLIAGRYSNIKPGMDAL